MKLHFPITPPYSSGSYPRVEPYDISDPEPVNWRLKTLVESTIHFWMYAVCSGKLSAVPPWELVESEVAPLRSPDHTFPDTINLYLEPNRVAAPQVAFPFAFALNGTLKEAGLGEGVRCYVYENLDPTLLSAPIQNQLNVNAALDKHKITSPAERWEMFAKGQVAIWINGGDALAQASAHNASMASHFMAQFAVMTTTGLVNPIYFFDLLQAHLHDPTDYPSFKSTIAPNWFPATPKPPNSFIQAVTAPAVVTAAQQRLYPAAALYEAKQTLSLTDAQWRAVGNGQKDLHWDRLRRSSGHSTTGNPFVFSTDDMVNPFQLEAVAEFFIAWPEPATAGTVPPANVPQPSMVDLQAGDWNLVFIDPFHHATLGNPQLPMPEYFLEKHTPPNNTRCDSANPLPSPFNADTYNAVLFLIHKGEVKAWYRWSTFTSHKWECAFYHQCNLASSALGNQTYHFRSFTSSEEKAFINYAFLLSDVLDGSWVPARFYSRAGMPSDDGTAAGDAEAKKSGVIIHQGLSADILHKTRFYNGSGGCFVSPNFCPLRNTMIALYMEEEFKKPASTRDMELSFLGHLTPSQGMKIRTGDLKMPNGTRYQAAYWNDKIRGMCYVIRPDEPTQK